MLQTRNKNRLIWRGIVILALLTALPGTPVAAEQTFDEAAAAAILSVYFNTNLVSTPRWENGGSGDTSGEKSSAISLRRVAEPAASPC